MKPTIEQSIKLSAMIIKLYDQINHLSENHNCLIALCDIDFKVIEEIILEMNREDIIYNISINDKSCNTFSKLLKRLVNRDENDDNLNLNIHIQHENFENIEIIIK